MLERLRYSWRTNKNVRLGVIAGLLVGGAMVVWIGIYIALTSQQSSAQIDNTTVRTIDVDVTADVLEEADSGLIDRATDGTEVTDADARNQPIALMIENAAFGGVRPQSGLSEAEIIYELVVEGGITRLMAVYSAAELPSKIGPVRSARPTYLEFVSEFDALYGHAGGSPEALQAVDGLGLKDLNALGADGRYFYRDGEKVAPHNLFTSNDLLHYALRDKQLEEVVSTFEQWAFKEDTPPSSEPSEERFVEIDFGSGPLYEVRFVYDFANNLYERYNGGELQRDANSEQTLTAHNVIVQIVPSAEGAGESGRVNFSVTGEGDAYIARDGKVIEGSWKKADRTTRTQFFDDNGDPIELNRGTTWVEILPITGSIDYN